MAYRSLRDFIARLESAGRLSRVQAPVSPHLEMTEIQTRLIAEEGPAVLFENVVGDDGTRFDMPVLVNLFGTVERVAWGMNREPGALREVGETLAFLRQPEPPSGWREAVEMLPLLNTVRAMKPRTVGDGPVQEVVLTGDDIDLARLPIQTCWPGEPAPLITWPLVVTKGPSKSRIDNYNLGIYRMQVTGRDTTLMRWLAHRGGAQQHRRWGQEKREPLPAAAVIGADPGTILAAVTPVPDTLSEYQFAGLLRGQKVELVRAKTVPLEVPAEAEIVIEGHVSLDDYRGRRPLRRSYRLLQRGRAVPRVHGLRHHHAARSDLPLDLHRAPAGRAEHPGRGAQRGLHSAAGPAVPGDRRFLAAAGGLQLPDRRGLHQEGLRGPRQAGDDGRLVLSAAVHVYEVGDRGGRRHRCARLEGRDVGGLHPHGPGARHHHGREHAHRLSRLREPGAGLGAKVGLDATTKIGPETGRTWGTRIRMADEIVERVTGKWETYGLPGSGKPIWR